MSIAAELGIQLENELLVAVLGPIVIDWQFVVVGNAYCAGWGTPCDDRWTDICISYKPHTSNAWGIATNKEPQGISNLRFDQLLANLRDPAFWRDFGIELASQ